MARYQHGVSPDKIDYDHHHVHSTLDLAQETEFEREQWQMENVELRTVGIDIGSSTSHLMFSRVHLQRKAQGLSSRFVVVAREVLWRSPIMLTPYLHGNTIDADALARFVDDSYRSASVEHDDIDSGAVILTGEALKRRNARAIAELFADHGGKFVCASAGHHLEATMAAHGSGAVALSRSTGKVVLHLDIGGGTTKRALIADGEILETAAIAAGGRLIALTGGVADRIEQPAAMVAEHLGIPLALGQPVSTVDVTRIVDAMAGVLVELARGEVTSPLARSLLVTDPPGTRVQPELLTVSGGVAEYLYRREDSEFGDIAVALASAVRQRLADELDWLPLHDSGQRIRATVIGASQFSVQVSGNTVDVLDPSGLPKTNLPVLTPRLDLDGDIRPETVRDAIVAAAKAMDAADGRGEVALGMAWHGDPSYPRLCALAEGIVAAREHIGRADQPLVLLLSADIARSIGRLLRSELGLQVPMVVLDGLELQEFDYVDIGELIQPSRVVPVIIKSLLFDGTDPQR